MDVLRFFVDFLVGAGLPVAVFALIALLVRLVRLVFNWRVLRRAVVSAPPSRSPARPFWSPARPSWSLTLLVEVDDDEGLIRPSVQLRGSALPFAARLRLDLVDERGAIRLTRRRSLPPWAIGTQLALPALSPPDGAGVDDVLSWHWDVVIED